ncbi:Addiction module protein [Candidatus Methylobacter favarea]|uniref:Addiction module protein n=1 Tax=Candidatus Methylobacter favarea TaxID=2707345 RepID=A0A8S0X1X2_9GAMM|nr:addiction module protein [Candidatus Methylobacter favarea]CAA9891492.1 Addiction module protein [Candidatus Methylobacter favarea]
MKTKELIAEAVSLPVEERALLVDSLLKSLNMPDSVIDKKWVEVTKDRLQQLRAGEVMAQPANEVFKKIAARFQQ